MFRDIAAYHAAIIARRDAIPIHRQNLDVGMWNANRTRQLERLAAHRQTPPSHPPDEKPLPQPPLD
jgi:hypothetical protein